MSYRALRTLVATTALFEPTTAFAHTGHTAGDVHGFVHGLAHPLTGLDHVLAMVAVGLLAAHVGGRALWSVPAAFLGMMAVGGALGMAGVALPALGAGIALSVVVLGLAAAGRTNVGTALAVALAGVFAIFHGVAHGTEIPNAAGGVAFAGGFLLATAMLHACGIGLGLGASRLGGTVRLLPRATAGSIAALGLGLLAGVI